MTSKSNTKYTNSSTKLRYKTTEFIKIGTEEHSKIISCASSENKLIGRLISKCDLEVLNNRIIILRYPQRSIYSEQAECFKSRISDFFNRFVKKKVEVIPYVASLNSSIQKL
jgi:hypothetical protein